MATRSSYSGSSASESSSSSQQLQEYRVRTVKLTRRTHPPTRLGFSIRGGCEHGTGFFITSVEPASEAQIQGLMVGDQIIRVNGYPVDDATHQEVLQLIQRHNVVTLKVKAVGMIPVKDNPDDELTWRIVEPEIVATTDLIRPDLIEDHPALRSPSDVRMVLKVPPKAKLGCGICKGPEWKPGVFVQFTKENSIARAAGLRPGDQIIQCNNFTFIPETPFNEAVSVLRCSGVLELMVRKGAGVDLFPGESSGYNSSASSVAGDNPWPNRLSSVAEESSGNSRNDNKINGFDQNGRMQNGNHNVRTDYPNGCTVIRVGGDECDSKSKLAEICMVSQQLETKTTTVLVEVHHSEEDDVSHTNSDSSTDRLTNSSSVSSFTSSACSLSSAISQELERRSKRANAGSSAPQPTDKLVKSGLAKEKVQQHEQLMQEFKRAHRKMFSSSEIDKDTATLLEEREEQKQQEQKRLNSNDIKLQVELNGKGKDDVDRACARRQPAPPPPPPPLPSGECPSPQVPKMSTQAAAAAPTSMKKYPAPPPPSPPHCPTPDYDTMVMASNSSGGTSNPPKSTLRNGSQKGDAVEMQSLESFKLTNPSVTKPKPPNIYFARKAKDVTNSSDSSNGTHSTLPMKDTKPVVTIREYPGTKERRSPAKFDFLQNGMKANKGGSTQPITSGFQSELTQTLSRANLQAKNEPIVSENVQNGHSKGTVVTISVSPEQMKSEPPKPFYLFPNDNQAFNGTDKNKNPKTFVNLCKSINDKPKLHPIDNYNKNSVTFNFGKKDNEKKNVAIIHPNGILKNGSNM